MLETLKKFIAEENVPKINSENDMILKIGGAYSQYYNACHTIARVMLLELDKKQRGVIFYGVAGSGKSFIAKIMRDIFDCHWKQQGRTVFDEKIFKEDTNK